MTHRIKDFLGLIFWLSLSYSPALTGIFFRPGQWYQGLDKSALTPPDWVFAPVWTLLYLMMGVSAWLVWRSGNLRQTAGPLGLFVMQLAFNALWSWFFFGLCNPCYALVNIGILLALIIFLIIVFLPLNRLAAALLIPYLLWVAFASYLNFQIWINN